MNALPLPPLNRRLGQRSSENLGNQVFRRPVPPNQKEIEK
ncbi:hypothetical protein MCC93_05850 [Morococcus cerebrosus]|uniref:Uncharacterized protein n=1 Tax=Morococcus cerebrosus TaxID=1056807 RepID=A0A0C1EG06_9NEIS|nr:hypothetical protein MCC93_05850 [Morococcus cerebrosus]